MKYLPSLSVIAIASACAMHTQASTIITDITGLQNINNELSADYILANDINAAGFPFIPIGIDVAADPFIALKEFTGTLDGKGFKIDGLTISHAHNPFVGAGLFWQLGPAGAVKNLNLTNINYSVTNIPGGAGGIVAQSKGTITNSSTTGTITAEGGPHGEFTGGLAGINYPSGVITDSYSAVNITSINNFAGPNFSGNITGGLVGHNDGTISNSYATGSVTGPNHNLWVHATGGLVGTNGGTISKSYAVGPVAGDYDTGGLVGANFGNIANSYAIGSVNGGIGASTEYVKPYIPGAGALVGFSEGGAISSSYAIGRVSAGQNTPTGGLIGTNTNTTVTTSYWDTQTTGQATSAGGTARTTNQLQSGILPSGFNPSVWSATAGQYPKLTGVGGQGQSLPNSLPVPLVTKAPPIDQFPAAAQLADRLSLFLINNSEKFDLGVYKYLLPVADVLTPFKSTIDVVADNLHVLGIRFGMAKTIFDFGTSNITDWPVMIQEAGAILTTKWFANDDDAIYIGGLTATLDALKDTLTSKDALLGLRKGTLALIDVNAFLLGELLPYEAKKFVASDPPDLDFRQIYVPPVLTFPNIASDTPALNSAFSKVGNDIIDAALNLRGATTSVNRYSSALEASDAISATLQLEALSYYLQRYDRAIHNATLSMESLLSILEEEGFLISLPISDLLSQLQSQLSEIGFDTEALAFFHRLGLTDAQIDDALSELLSLDLNTDSFKQSAYEISRILTTAGLPINSVPEPSSIVVLISTLVMLGGLRFTVLWCNKE